MRRLIGLAAVVLVAAGPAWAQPIEWKDDFLTSDVYDDLSLLGPCYGGPPTKYTMIEPFLADIINEQAQSGGGNFIMSNSSTLESSPGFGRVELAIVGHMGLGIGCPGDPPLLISSLTFDDPDVCIYAGFELVKAKDLNGEYTWGAALDMDLGGGSWIYLNIDPAASATAPSDLFSIREFVLGVDGLVEGANDPGASDLIAVGYALNTEYNYSFCVSGGNSYAASLWIGTNTANPIEILGPIINNNHSNPSSAVVALQSKVRSGFLLDNATHQGNNTFWVIEGDPAVHYPSPHEDLDNDRDVDANDFLTFSNCFNGSLNPPSPPCDNTGPANPANFADLDGDADVDANDFLTFSNCFNGALTRPKPICMPPIPVVP